MKALLDTHVVLWALNDDPRLSAAHRDLIGTSELYVSAATLWEISIKRALGKLVAPPDHETVLAEAGCRALAITWRHGTLSGTLPPHHADPFDRLLIAQSMIEALPLATTDARIREYGIEIV